MAKHKWILGRWTVAPLLFPLFSRLRRDTVEENPRRQMILAYVERNPNARFHEMRRDLELAPGVLAHHLGMLRRQRLVILDRVGRTLSARLPGQAPPTHRIDGGRALLDLLAQNGEVSLEEAARALGWTRRRTRYWAGVLESAGRLRSRREGPWRLLGLQTPTLMPPPS